MKIKILFPVLLVLVVTACIEKKDTDKERPVVELLLPQPCDTLYFGQSFLYSVKITDNTGLGNISMDLHNNFGHHNHGDHETCNMDPAREAVNPYANNWLFSLPSDQTVFIFDTLLSIPLHDANTASFDTGDYHFHIYITDNEGYQVFTTLDVKILR
jgi:hypothetical protein